MLKIRIILMSFFALLLVGMNMNVSAGIDSELVQETTDKDKSSKESHQHEPSESMTELDFFGAFSLVNVQLQWRDLHAGLNKEATDVESSEDQKELALEVEMSSLNSEIQSVPTSPVIKSSNAVVPLSVYRPIDETLDFIGNAEKQAESTIAYILNCGTYPLSI